MFLFKASLKQSDESLEFVGCLLSVDCGKEGIFQGVVEQLDVGGKTITLRKPMKYVFTILLRKVIILIFYFFNFKYLETVLRFGKTRLPWIHDRCLM